MSNPANDRPLSGAANFMLLLGATGTMALFYCFTLGSILLLLVILLVEVIFFVAALRFGAAGFIIPVIQGHGRVFVAFCRCLKLGKAPVFRIPLKKSDDPELYETLKNICQKAGVPLLRRVYLDVSDQWAEFAIESPSSPHKFVKLGETYESARHDEKASELFQHALTLGHYPEALVGLGRLEIHRRNFAQARTHLLAALNLNLPVGEESVNTVELVLPIFMQLKLLQDPILNCKAWIVSMSQQMKPAALANVTLLVYAPTLTEAQGYLNVAVAAMQPDLPANEYQAATWKPGLREQQPDGPVHPGIQGLLS